MKTMYRIHMLTHPVGLGTAAHGGYVRDRGCYYEREYHSAGGSLFPSRKLAEQCIARHNLKDAAISEGPVETR